ncbi:MAG: cyclopropane-fatty-acyl-phospholipid synthase family protein [Alphaproteobacteria bacterium]
MNANRQQAMALTSAGQALGLDGVPRMLRVLMALGTQLRRGRIVVRLADGREFQITGDEPGTHGQITVNNVRMGRRMLLGGGVGLAEAYLDGDWDTDDLCALLTMAAENEEVFSEELLGGSGWRRLLNRAMHLLRPNTKAGSRRNIADHYDLGNDFYAAWLDGTMTYSAAIYAEGGNSLEAAQHEKYRRLAELLQVRPEHHVLEIGCGWGGFAEYLGATVGAKVTAITISAEQHVYAVERIAKAGLSDRVEVKLCDYRDTAGTFDRVASIEMIEAVGAQFWPLYFKTLRDRLRPGGRAALQAITIHERHYDNYRASPDFIQRYIFPGGMLPTPTILREQTAAAGLTWVDHYSFGQDYGRTLGEWHDSFRAAWPSLEALGRYDERFRRMWDYYLAYCRAGFVVGFTDVHQIALARD